MTGSSEWSTRQELLAAGWTATEIRDLLGDPDKIETWRKRGHGTGPRHLYRRDRVAEAAPYRGRKISLRTRHGPVVLWLSATHAWLDLPTEDYLIEITGDHRSALMAVQAQLQPRKRLDNREIICNIVDEFLEQRRRGSAP